MSRLLPADAGRGALLLGAIVWELQDVAGPDPGTAVRARGSAVPVARAAPEAGNPAMCARDGWRPRWSARCSAGPAPAEGRRRGGRVAAMNRCG